MMVPWEFGQCVLGWQQFFSKNRPTPPLPPPDSDNVWERSAMIPRHNRPAQPFSRETEAAEIKRLKDAQAKTEEMSAKVLAELKAKEDLLAKLKAENAAAAFRGKLSARTLSLASRPQQVVVKATLDSSRFKAIGKLVKPIFGSRHGQ
ncbi:hypothetical protein ARSEF4850_003612 [Beauveria asiatica]